MGIGFSILGYFWNGIISDYDFGTFERFCIIGIICIIILAALGIKIVCIYPASRKLLLVVALMLSCIWRAALLQRLP